MDHSHAIFPSIVLGIGYAALLYLIDPYRNAAINAQAFQAAITRCILADDVNRAIKLCGAARSTLLAEHLRGLLLVSKQATAKELDDLEAQFDRRIDRTCKISMIILVALAFLDMVGVITYFRCVEGLSPIGQRSLAITMVALIIAGGFDFWRRFRNALELRASPQVLRDVRQQMKQKRLSA